MQKRLAVVVAGVAVVAAACAPAPPPAPTLNRSVVVSGQGSVVWDIGFVNANTYFFTLRSGAIKAKVGAAAPVTLGTPPDSTPTGEGGVMGLAVDPAFASNRLIYVCYLTAADVRVVSYAVNANFTGFDAGPTPIVTGMPRAGNGRHSGCRLRFKPGTDELFIGTGDAATGTNPQSHTSLGGKILRVTRTGAAYPGNPGYADARIYNHGHRNVQGLSFRTKKANAPFSAEHGTGRDDEVNQVLSGRNYGWDPVPGYNEQVPMTDFNKFPGAVRATWSSGSPTVAPSGMTFLSGAQWKSWDGALVLALLSDSSRGCRLRVLFLNGDGTAVNTATDVLKLGVRLRTAVQGPDGNLYIGTDSGEIWRVVPS